MDLFDAPAYWGRITREDAEEILTECGLDDGLYLIREKFEEAGIYAITVCYFKRFYHYRIERLLNGCVVLSGSRIQEKLNGSTKDLKILQFSDPIELISYFEKNTEQLVTKLTIPCSRPKNHNFVQYWSAPFLDPDLFIKKIHQEASTRDLHIPIKDKLNAKRYIYERRVLRKLHEGEPWFHACINRSEAEIRLKKAGAKNGLFLIREKDSEKPFGTLFTLSICYQNQFHHYLIDNMAEGYVQIASADRSDLINKFGSIVHLVDFYHRYRQDIACSLIHPCSRPGGSMCITSLERLLELQNETDPNEGYTLAALKSEASDSDQKQSVSSSNSQPESISIEEYFIDEKKLTVGEKLGEGQFGEVFEGKLIGISKYSNGKHISVIDVAIKQIKSDSNSFSKDSYEEAQRMLSLDHPYIVHIIGLCKQDECVSIILELCPYGAMNQWLKNNGTFRMKYILNYMYQVCDGMSYLHQKSIIHRDLALRNILIMSKKICKISDFGLSRFLEANNYYQIGQNRRLPSMWYPPEVLETGIFHSQIDVWSFGVTMWEATSYGESPYKAELESMKDTIFQPVSRRLLKFLSDGNRLKQPVQCPDNIYEIILKCWEWDKHKRPAFKQIKDYLNPYFMKSFRRDQQESNGE